VSVTQIDLDDQALAEVMQIARGAAPGGAMTMRDVADRIDGMRQTPDVTTEIGIHSTTTCRLV
jgi:hypothetical protein